MRWTLVVMLALAGAGALLYLWPVPQKDFASLAINVDPNVTASLINFRQTHPLKSIENHGETWHYVVDGQGAETILFLHGMTGAYDIWWQQMEALSPDFRVISVTYPPIDTLEGLSEGVIAVLDAENVQHTYVVGTSLGGYLAQYLLATHPQRLKGVVFANTFPPNDYYKQKNETLIRLLPLLPTWLVMKSFRENIQQSIYPASGYSELALAYLLEQTYGRMSKAQVAARAKAVLDDFAPPDPEALGVPVLIIEADNDPLVPAQLRAQLKETYPSANVHTLSGVGHFPYLNAPDDYTAILRAFLTKPPAKKPGQSAKGAQ